MLDDEASRAAIEEHDERAIRTGIAAHLGGALGAREIGFAEHEREAIRSQPEQLRRHRQRRQRRRRGRLDAHDLNRGLTIDERGRIRNRVADRQGEAEQRGHHGGHAYITLDRSTDRLGSMLAWHRRLLLARLTGQRDQPSRKHAQ